MEGMGGLEHKMVFSENQSTQTPKRDSFTRISDREMGLQQTRHSASFSDSLHQYLSGKPAWQ